MNILKYLLFILGCGFNVHFIYAQNNVDFELYQQFYTDKDKNVSTKLKAWYEYQSIDESPMQLSRSIFFNEYGLPICMKEFDSDNDSTSKIFTYDTLNRIIGVETFDSNSKIRCSKFYYDSISRLKEYKNFNYLVKGNEGLIWIKKIEYFNTGFIKHETLLTNNSESKIEEIFNDSIGRPTKKINYRTGIRNKITTYVWKTDGQAMTEYLYDTQNLLYDSIFHLYLNHKEISRQFGKISKQDYYWLYDDLGRVAMTNSSGIYSEENEYNGNFLIKKSIRNIDNSSNIYLPGKVDFYYKYFFY